MPDRRWLVLLLLLAAPVAAGEEAWREAVDRLGDRSPEVRATARSTLAEAGADAGGALEAGLRSGKPLVAAACADLAREGAVARTRAALAAAAEDPSTPALVARAAVRALGVVGDYRDVEVLASLLPRIPESAGALLALADEGGREAVLAAFREGSAGPDLAFAAASLGSAAAVEALIAGLEGGEGLRCLSGLRRLSGRDLGEDPEAWRGWWRRESLARRLGDPDWDASERALEQALREEGESVRRDLRAIAVDVAGDRYARAKAILALGLLEDRESGEALLRVLEGDPDGHVRLYAAEALGRIGRPEFAVDLAGYLIFDEEKFRELSAKDRTDTYYTIDSEVCRALVRLGVKGGLDFMIRQLAQQHRVRIYHAALRTLRAVTGREFDYRPDGNAESRRAAAERWREWFDENREALELETPAPDGPVFRARVARLVDTLGHFHFLSMSRARQTLHLLGEAALPELVAGLSRPGLHVPIHCAEILGWIHAKSARPALARLLRHGHAEIRTAAMAALAEMGPGDFADEAIAGLSDESADVRIEAARALARVEASRAVPALLGALDAPGSDPDEFRREAQTSLAVHGRREGVDALARMLDHADLAFRQSVAERLRRLTGRDPGVEADGIAAWREWWKVARERYSSGAGGGAPR